MLMRSLSTYAITLLLGCYSLAAQGQSSVDQKAAPLPPAKHGQPVFSFSGGQRVSVQKNTAEGMHEYGAGGTTGSGSVAGTGTGIVEIGGSKNFPVRGTGIGTGSVEGSGTGSEKASGITVVPASGGKLVGKNGLTGGSGGGSGSKNKPKPATTVVQILGPDGKMQYKEVLFMGTLPANKRAPNITDVKDGEGKVKEYGWAKNAH